MDIRLYRGYQLYLGETVDIYHNGERIDSAPSLAAATSIIDDWRDNAR